MAAIIIFNGNDTAGKGAAGDGADVSLDSRAGVVPAVYQHGGECALVFKGATCDFLNRTSIVNGVPGVPVSILSGAGLLASGKGTAGDLVDGSFVAQCCLAVGDHIYNTAANTVLDGQSTIVDDRMVILVGQTLAIQIKGDRSISGDSDIFSHIRYKSDCLTVSNIDCFSQSGVIFITYFGHRVFSSLARSGIPRIRSIRLCLVPGVLRNRIRLLRSRGGLLRAGLRFCLCRKRGSRKHRQQHTRGQDACQKLVFHSLALLFYYFDLVLQPVRKGLSLS